MLSKKVLDALNEQINKEIYSAYFYLGMSAFAASNGLPGVANWFYVQWKEELGHAKKMFDYVHQKGERVRLKAIDEPPQDFTSGADLFEKTLAHEKKVTGLIKSLSELAKKEDDKDTENFLQWFVKEQVEEEEHSLAILEQIKCVGDVPGHLFYLDHHLGKRE